MNVLTLESKLWSKVIDAQVTRADIEQAVCDAANDAAVLLPGTFEFTNIIIQPGEPQTVIPEVDVVGVTYSSEYLSVTFDYTLPYGRGSLLRNLRSQTYHELVHAVTFEHDSWRPDVMYGVVTEGLATVFEREHGGAGVPLWSVYESDDVMQKWYDELQRQPISNEKDTRYFFLHPDGRRWIVYKTGVWMIDKLIASGEDLYQLMKLEHTEIITRFEKLG